MNVQMLAQEFPLTTALRHYTELRLGKAFASARLQVTRIVVRLRDLNGPRGGRDMVCQINVTMPGMPEVVIREVQDDMYAAIDGAVHRAAYSAGRATRKHPLSRERMTTVMAQGEEERVVGNDDELTYSASKSTYAR